MKYIVIIGDVVNGVRFYGPFATIRDATDYADEFTRGEEWIIGTVNSP
jgi:hypothetical protein